MVHDADGLSEERMAAFARWTNLSETTFLLAPTVPEADYRLRIFTPGGELPFAGHPTLGSAHAWLEAGGVPHGERIMQECGVGLVELRRDEAGLAFAGPPLRRSGPVGDELRDRIAAVLRVPAGDVVDAAWCDNGPGWIGVRVGSAEQVLALEPDFVAMAELKLGVVGPYGEGSDPAVEVRAFASKLGIREDPVTGSLNAALGQWLAGTVLPSSYTASQGTVLQRRGRVRVEREGDTVWVGGRTRTTISGTVDLG